MRPSRTKFIMFVRAVARYTSAAAEAELNKALRCSGRKPSGPVDDEEEKTKFVRLTLFSVTVVQKLSSFFDGFGWSEASVWIDGCNFNSWVSVILMNSAHPCKE